MYRRIAFFRPAALLSAALFCWGTTRAQAQLSSLDATFNAGFGASAQVSDIAVQSNGKIVVAGSFTNFNTLPRGHIVRLNANGNVDLTFSSSARLDGDAYSVAIQANGQIVVAGDFQLASGSNAVGVARFNADGTVDASFRTGTGANGVVEAVEVQSDGKIVLAGDFTAFNGVAVGRIARLNADGSLDTSFNVGAGLNGPVYDIALQADGKIVLVGDFSLANGESANGVARLTANGSVDAAFDTGTGLNGAGYAVDIDASGNIVVGGSFTAYDSVAHDGLVRLEADGDVDASFHVILNAGADVAAVTIEGDGQIVIGGTFTAVNGASIEAVARLNADGSVDSSFNTEGAVAGEVAVVVVQPDGRVLAGGDFSANTTVHINIARLTSGSNPLPEPPVIILQPIDEIVSAGATAVFEVGAASSTEVEYEWQRNGIVINGQNSSRLELDSVTSAQAGEYTVIVSNAAGATTSSSATLSVEVPDRPVIIVQPEDQNVTAGADVTFTVMVSGTAPLQYQWLKNGIEISGETRASLALQAVTTADSGDYSVVVSNNAGAETSAGASLIVEAAVAPVVVVPPADQTVPPGATVLLSVSATGTAPLAFQWSKGTLELQGETSATLMLEAVTAIDAGDYSVRVSNAAGATVSESATVTIGVPVPPSITLEPLSQSVTAGADVTFTVVAAGTAPLSYIWRRDGATLGGEADASLTLESVTTAEAGEYSVIVSNSVGIAVSATATLTVTPPPPPTIVVPPVDLTVSAGATVAFSVVAVGQGPLEYEWRFEGQVIAEADANVLVLTEVSPDDAGTYEVRITDETGASVTATAELTVVVAPELPGLPDVNFDVSFQGEAEINSVLIQADGRIIIAGSFTNVNGTELSGVARLHADGSIDESFDTGAGPNAAVLDAALQADGEIVIAGEFTGVDGVAQEGVARLHADGSIDLNFTAAVDGPVTAVAVQADGRIVIAGEFTTVNGTPRDGTARLNADGSLDASFDAGTGANGPVLDLAVQADAKILVAGDFSSFNSVAAEGLVRLNAQGSVDTTFDAALEATGGFIASIDLEEDGQILVGGSFSAGANGQVENVARLNANGSLDTSFDAGAGPDGAVLAVAAAANGQVLIGGDFNLVDATVRPALARLNADGSVDAAFNGNVQITGNVGSIAFEANGNIIAGGSADLVRLFGAVEAEVRLFGAAYSNGRFSISVDTENNQRYILEAASALPSASWTVVAEATGDGSVKVLTDGAAVEGYTFYRVRVEAAQ